MGDASSLDHGRTAGQFDDWNTRVSTLKNLYSSIQRIARGSGDLLGDPTDDDRFLRLENTGSVFERETFRIMVIGEFSSGKSTLINAMLGKRLLPTKANPATAFTTVLRWGENEHAELYRSVDGRGGMTVVGIEEFQREVSLQIDADGAPREPSFLLAVVSQPLELLRRSVEIVDSAGVNESPARERVTLGFLEQVDAVIFVTDAGRPFTLHETQNYLRHVQELGHEDIFFVVNQFDRIDEEERAEVQSRCRNAVAEIGADSGRNIFFVSARDALRARLDGDTEGLRKSGIDNLERALESFCMNDAARVKFVRLAEFLRHSSVDLRRRLQEESGLLAKSAAELRDLLDQSQQTQDQIQQNVTQIGEIIDRWISDVERQIKVDFTAFLRDLSTKVPSWEAKGSGRIDRARKTVTKSGRETLQREIVKGYMSNLQRKMQVFCNQEIDPLIRDRQQELIDRIDPLIKAHEEAFEELRGTLTGTSSEPDPDYLLRSLAFSVVREGAAEAHHGDVPLLFRPNPVMAIGAGTGAAAGGAALAAASLIGLVMPPLGLMVGIGAALGPIVAAGAVVLSDGKLRDLVAEKFADDLYRSAESSAEQYALNRATELRSSWSKIEKGLAARLQELIASVKRSIEESRVDEQEKQRLRNGLYQYEQQLTVIEGRIGDFLRPYVVGRTQV